MKETYYDKILSFIHKNGSIDPDQFFDICHSHKLASRISELIVKGYPIEKVWVYKKGPNGKMIKSHKAYSLRRENNAPGSDNL